MWVPFRDIDLASRAYRERPCSPKRRIRRYKFVALLAEYVGSPPP